MKKNVAILVGLSSLLIASCSITSRTKASDMKYETKEVNLYRKKDTIDKKLKLRFYESTPNVPYIGVKEFYEEFFKSSLFLSRSGDTYKYTNLDLGYLKFDISNDVLTMFNLDSFSGHPDSKETSSKTFMINESFATTSKKEKVISLANYRIDLHGDEEAYVPISLLSSISGGLNGYSVGYNGKDLFVFDNQGYITGVASDYDYYEDLYLDPIIDVNKTRPVDLATFNYFQLCLNFDNFRGYTSQLFFGDNNLLSLGLNGLLEKYYPTIKTLLLSTDKANYLAGMSALFDGLQDGGHTVSLTGSIPAVSNIARPKLMEHEELVDLSRKTTLRTVQGLVNDDGYTNSKKAAFPDDYGKQGETKKVNYYKYDSTTQTAYLGFDKFVVNYEQWNKYYTKGMKKEDIPDGDSDTYAFVLNGLNKAVEDNVKNLVLDLSTNGGGNSAALIGIVGLFNNGKCVFETNNLVGGNRNTNLIDVDINLDGVFNQKDIDEAKKFREFKTAILTSPCSFSCGNLLPSMMKELGYKIVGKRSGGGSCAVAQEITADGLIYVRSSYQCLSNSKGENIDSGVPLDYEIEVSYSPYEGMPEITVPNAAKFYDFTKISTYLNSLN